MVVRIHLWGSAELLRAVWSQRTLFGVSGRFLGSRAALQVNMDGKDFDLCPDSLGVSVELVTNTLGCPSVSPSPRALCELFHLPWWGRDAPGVPCEGQRGTSALPEPWTTKFALFFEQPRNFIPKFEVEATWLHFSPPTAPGAWSSVCCGVLWAVRPSNLPGRASASLCSPKPLLCAPALCSPTF